MDGFRVHVAKTSEWGLDNPRGSALAVKRPRPQVVCETPAEVYPGDRGTSATLQPRHPSHEALFQGRTRALDGGMDRLQEFRTWSMTTTRVRRSGRHGDRTPGLTPRYR